MAWARLALIHAATDSEILHKTAELFGFELQASRNDQIQTSIKCEASTSFSGESTQTGQDVKSGQKLTASFFRLVSIESFAEPKSGLPQYLTDPLMPLQPKASPASYRFTTPAQLLPIPRLLPLLHNSIGQACAQGRLDYRYLNKQLAEGKPLKRLPYKKRLRWPKSLQIIVDTRAALEPYHHDFALIVKYLHKLLGTGAVSSLCFDEESLDQQQAYSITWPTLDHHEFKRWQLPAPDVAILILSDLGVAEQQSVTRRRWQCLFSQLRHHPAPILTLSPALHSPRNRAMNWIMRPNPLHNRLLLPRHPYQRGFSLVQPQPEQLDDILALLSPLPVVDTGLLRRLRIELCWGDSELEGYLWNHPATRRIGLGICLRESTAAEYRLRYQERFAGSFTAEQLWRIVHEHHRHVFDGLRYLEAFNQHLMEQTDDDITRVYLKRLGATLMQAEIGSPLRTQLTAQCRTFLASRPTTIWQGYWADIAYDLYALAYQDQIRAGHCPAILEPGFDIAKLQWILDPAQQDLRETWQILPSGEPDGIRVQRESTAASFIQTTPIASLLAQPAFPPTLHLLDLAQPNRVLHDGEQLRFLGELTFKSTLQQITLETFEKPKWATAVGHDADGLFVETVSRAGLRQRYDWRIVELGQGQSIGLWYPHNLQEATAWASNSGIDQYGLYADLTLRNITQRFRWLAPGEFLMGSPADELERLDNEIQHRVILTEGYWLADSACTQAFWQAVMGKNPAEFKQDKQNPVEQVSWLDVQQFIAKLNAQVPSLNACLPTEAQWEYACRAGTLTPFAFGANITPEQVNYDGNYPYAGGQKGQYREQTVPVKSLPPNAWGLYAMHGNVWECCQDWYGDYPEQAVTDPPGPADGTIRVLRGGSWYDYGGLTRSARRFGIVPVNRDHYFGFRLALGQAGKRRSSRRTGKRQRSPSDGEVCAGG